MNLARPIWPAYALGLCLIAALCFGNLHTHLLDTHDADSFSDHLQIQQDGTFFFSPDKAQASGRPVAEAVKYLVFLICGNDPAAFHLFSVAVHALASLLLARTVWRHAGQLILAGLAGVLFVVNVTHFQAVHHISAIDYPLALCFGLGALLVLERPAAVAALLVLGILSHPSIAVAWLLAAYMHWRRDDLTTALRALWPSGLATAVAVALSLHLAAASTSTWQSIDEYGAQSAAGLVPGMLRVLLWFCSRLLTTAHWLPLPIYVQQTWELAVGAGLVGLLLWLVWRRKEPLATAALATLLGLLPYLLLTEATVLDLPAGPSRYLYLASAGSSLLLAWSLDWIRRRVHSYAAVALLLATLASSYHSLARAEAISLYTSGRSYSAGREYATAREQFRRALVQGPETLPATDIYTRLCLLLMDSEEDHAAVLAEGLAAHPDSKRLRLLQLATVAADPTDENREKAMHSVLDLRHTAPPDAELVAKALHNIGAGRLHYKDDPGPAIHAYRQVLRIDRDRFKTLKDLTFAHWQRAAQLIDLMAAADVDNRADLVDNFREQMSDAIATSLHALRLRPDADLFYQLGRAYQQQERYAEALEAYRQGLAQNPADQRAHLRIAEILGQQGDKAGAARAREAATRRTPPTETQ